MFEEDYDVIDLREIFHIIKKHIKLIFLVPIIFAILGALISIYLIAPIYESSTTIIVSQAKDSNEAIDIGDVNLSKSLVYTYAEMAKSNTVIENTKKELNLDELSDNSIRVFPVKDTQILKITVQNTNPQLAMDIANTLVEKFTTEIIRITSTDNVAVIDYARMPEEPIKPDKFMNIAISAVLGEMIVIFVIFVREYLDNTLKSEKDIEKYLGIPTIGIIPNFNQGGRQKNGKVHNKKQSKIAYSGSVQESCS